MENAEKVKNLVVGKFYSVVCAIMESQTFAINHYVPIIPILHKDPQFGAAGRFEHYHLDGRFINDDYISGYMLYNHKTSQVIAPKDSSSLYIFKGLTRKRRKCRTLETGLNIDERYPAPISWSNWYKKMIGKSCEGKKCPHYGTEMTEINGRWICPLHNLEGCPTTKKIVKPSKIKLY